MFRVTRKPLVHEKIQYDTQMTDQVPPLVKCTLGSKFFPSLPTILVMLNTVSMVATTIQTLLSARNLPTQTLGERA
jgi:hypothetical protein